MVAQGKKTGRASHADDLDLGTDKLYFKIGEVAEILAVPAHVLRYWEREFTVVKPQKSRSQQRIYRRKDVATLLRIKHLLYDRRFTIAGARAELKEVGAGVQTAAVNRAYLARASLQRVRDLLGELQRVVAAAEAVDPRAADPSRFLAQAGGVAGMLAAEHQAEGRRSGGRRSP